MRIFPDLGGNYCGNICQSRPLAITELSAGFDNLFFIAFQGVSMIKRRHVFQKAQDILTVDDTGIQMMLSSLFFSAP